MSKHTLCPDTDTLISFLYDEFDGSEALDRRGVARHLDSCDRCAANIASLGGVRQALSEWAAPEMSLGFRVVADPPRRVWFRLPAWSTPALPLAAAAVLVLGAGLGLARLDVTYDANGLRLRTGWGHVETAQASRAGFSASPTTSLAGTAVTPAVSLAPPSAPGATADAPWRAELTSLERQLRQEFAALRQGGDRVSAANVVAGDPSASASASDQALLRRVQQMIDQSEVRQQQNLALRAAELSRDFDLQRRSDLVRIEQGFGRLNDLRAVDAEQQRQILNAIRVSQPQP